MVVNELLNKLKSYFWNKKSTITIELEDWYEWHKQPEAFHNAVVDYLRKEGKIVETLSITKHLTSNEISILLIDGQKYQLTVGNVLIVATPSAVLVPINS